MVLYGVKVRTFASTIEDSLDLPVGPTVCYSEYYYYITPSFKLLGGQVIHLLNMDLEIANTPFARLSTHKDIV
jgi:hypothetical protein